jgi:DNA-binding IclR family transcriptional regulator
VVLRQNTALAASKEAVKDRQYINSLARGFEILQAFGSEDNGLSNSELSARTGLPKPTVSRLTFTLLSLGYLAMDNVTGRYSLHPHILSLGYPVLQRLSIREVARPYLSELADGCKATASMGIRDGLEMIVIERTRHKSMKIIPVDIGVGRPMATSAMGNAYLAACTRPERERIFIEMEASEKDNWPEIKSNINQNLARYMIDGYCLSDATWRPDYVAVSAPLVLPDKTIIGIACGGMRDRLSPVEISQMGEKLVDMVAELNNISGYGTGFGR